MVRVTPLALAGASLIAVSVAVSPSIAVAQGDGFRFDRPRMTVSLQGGWSVPGEDSDLFGFARRELTVEEGDFASPALVAEAALRLTEHLDLGVGVEWAGRTVDSEFREYVTQDDQPIRQSTEFERRRVVATARGYLLPRGRRISQLAWIANRWSPYLGAGVGVGWYEFVQTGDFVDFETLDIFEDTFRAEGRGFTWHAAAGLDISLTEHFLVRGEYRYIGGTAGLEGLDFQGFDSRQDLSGSQFTVGIAARL